MFLFLNKIEPHEILSSAQSSMHYKMEAYLRVIVVSNSKQMLQKCHTIFCCCFSLHIQVMFTLHYFINCAVTYEKTHKVYILLKKKLLLKKNCTKHHLILHNIFAAEGSCLNIDDCWLIMVMVVQIWGGCSNFLKKDSDICHIS